MPFPKKWRNPFSTSVTTEKWKHDLLKDLQVTDTHAYNQGVDSILSIQIEKGKVKSSIIEAYLESLNDNIAELQERATRVSKILEGKLDSERAIDILKKQRVKVWDLDLEEYQYITMDKFNPDCHKLIEKIPEEATVK